MNGLNSRVRRQARWALIACGSCFAVLFLLALSGASQFILQLHGAPAQGSRLEGIEGATMRTLIALQPAIVLLHAWGGYLAILLAGWSGIAFFGLARLLRHSPELEWRRSGAWMKAAAFGGAGVTILAVVLLLASGVATKGYFSHIDLGIRGDITSVQRGGGLEPDEALAGYSDSTLAEWHIKEMNYLLAIGALLLVAVAARARSISLQARKRQAEDIPDSEPDLS